MKTPERDELLNEILSPDELRATSLERTLTAARKQRRISHTMQGAGITAAFAILATLTWQQLRPPKTVSPVVAVNSGGAQPAAKIIPGTNIKEVSDDELLAMFPDRPVALVGPPQNRQFVFLDEKKLSKPSDKAPAHDHRL